MKGGRAVGVVLGLGGLSMAVFAVVRLAGSTPGVPSAAGPIVPTTRVTRGAIELDVRLNGELRSARSTTITAPAIGGNLRILQMADTGTTVKAGDLLLEFDPAEQQFALEQSRSELLEADQEVLKRQADQTVQGSQEKVTLLTAQFDLRRAQLDAAPDLTLVPANEHRLKQIALEEAKRRLAQVEQDLKAGAATRKAQMAVAEERRTKMRFAAQRAEQNIESLVVKAPIDGLVVVRENRDGGGAEGRFFAGMSVPEFRIGDNTSSGRPMMDIMDVSSMEIRSRVSEQERANVAEGQAAEVESQAVPGLTLPAKVISVAGLAAGRMDAGPLRQFELSLALSKADSRLRPGTSVRIIVKGRRVEQVLHVPRQAVFERDGKPIVFVRVGEGFEPRTIKVLHRSESRVAIEGVDEQAEVALVDPDRAAKMAAPKADTSRPGAGR